MVLTINQETFDNTVKENMEEFGMNVDEAIEDTVKEFTAQGADLSRVIVDLMAHSIDSQPVKEAVTTLGNLLKEDNKTGNDFIPQLIIIRKECEKGLQQRVLAGKSGAYNVIIDLLRKNWKDMKDDSILLESLKTLTALMVKHPDLLDEAGVNLIMHTLKEQKGEEILIQLLKWVKECCILHEHNRQKIFDSGILDELKVLLPNSKSNVLCSILSVLCALVLDDDVRVEFGKAHEHARIIASDTLCSIMECLQKYQSDEAVMYEVLLTISSLVVRTEFCKKVVDAGALPIVRTVMTESPGNEKLIRQCLKVLKVLAGNDECKSLIIREGTGPMIVNCMGRHKGSAPTAVFGLGCVAALCLRSPENSDALFSLGIPVVIIDIMKAHPDSEGVQKNASWAIRNMVSRSRHQNKEFLSLGVEELLKHALRKFKPIEFDIKAALRDLECAVDLKEEWTGKGGKLTTEEKKLIMK